MVIDFPKQAQIPGLRQLWKLAFGDTDAFLDTFFDTAYAARRCRCIPEGDTVAAALYWFDCECEGRKLAYLYAVATHPDHRGRGLCRRLMQDTHSHLARQGYDGALLVPQDGALRKMYAAMGYRDATGISEFSCAAAAPVPLLPVDAGTYGKLRRQYLPKGGVVQEGENLAFLARSAELYAGEDLLLAVSGGEVLELLGNAEKAPGILGALGLPEGKFRTPGDDLPFAMFLPLKEDAPAPAYFGLAFD